MNRKGKILLVGCLSAVLTLALGAVTAESIASAQTPQPLPAVTGAGTVCCTADYSYCTVVWDGDCHGRTHVCDEGEFAE